MTISPCICKNLEDSSFRNYIQYKKDKVFQDYDGIVIGQCRKCGTLKTIKVNANFNPKQNRTYLYEENVDEFRFLFAPIINKTLKFKKEGKVLDVGCSSGLLLELFQKNGFDILGIEPNHKAYLSAQKNLKNRVFHGTLKKLFLNNKNLYDIIIYNHVLEHIENIEKEIELVKKMLNKNGLLVIGLPNVDNVIFKLRKKYWESLMPKEHIWHFSKKKFTNYLKKKGFQILEINYSDHKRQDYPKLKKIYFSCLSFMNKILRTGESMLIIASFK